MLGKWSLQHTAGLLGAPLKGADAPFVAVTSDTRQDCQQALFVALSGKHMNGHNYLCQASRQGAVGALISQAVTCPLPDIRVADTTRALGRLGAANRARFGYPVVGITGSSGKTTLANMLAGISRRELATHATLANHNNEIGTAQTLLGLSSQHRFGIVEMGVRLPGDMAWLTQLVRPDCALISSIGASHLASLHSLAQVAAEKRQIFAHAPGWALAPAGDAQQFALFTGLDSRTTALVFGLEADCPDQPGARLSQVELAPDSSSARLLLPALAGRAAHSQLHNQQQSPPKNPAMAGRAAHSLDICINTPGMHQLINASGAALAGWVHGLAADSIQAGLRAFVLASDRQHITSLDQALLIHDYYNANPSSMQAALAALQLHSPRPLAVALGDMLELGTRQRQFHRQLGEQLATAGVAAVFGYGELVKETGAAYRHACPQGMWSHASSHVAMATTLHAWLEQHPLAVVLVKGSRGMRMELLAAALQNSAHQTGRA